MNTASPIFHPKRILTQNKNKTNQSHIINLIHMYIEIFSFKMQCMKLSIYATYDTSTELFTKLKTNSPE